MEGRLSGADWLAGDKYTIADIASFPWVRGAWIALEIDLEKEFPGIARWVKRIDGREAVQRAKMIPEGGVISDEQLEVSFKAKRENIKALKGTEKEQS